MAASACHLPRQRQPELERGISHGPALGDEAPEDVGFVRCLAQGFPRPLARWHHHEEYELHHGSIAAARFSGAVG